MIDLPSELWHETIMYLWGRDILSLRLVSKTWDDIITREIHRHARNSKLEATFLQHEYTIWRYWHYLGDFTDYVFGGSNPGVYTSIETKLLPCQGHVEYSFYTPEDLQPDDDIGAFKVPMKSLLADRSKWEFNFVQNAGSWSWSFRVLWSVGQDLTSFEVFFSPELVEPGPRGEARYGPPGWLRIKVPLKVLAHQYAGNLGEN